MSEIRVVTEDDRAQAARLRTVRDINTTMVDLKASGFEPVTALLDKAAQLDASVQEQTSRASGAVPDVVSTLLAAGKVTDDVLTALRSSGLLPGEMERLRTVVNHAVAATLRDACAAAVTAGPKAFAGLRKVAMAAVADAAKVAPRVPINNYYDQAQALAAGITPADLDTLDTAWNRFVRAHNAVSWLREIGALPAHHSRLAASWLRLERPWQATPPGYRPAFGGLELAIAINNGAKPGMFDLDEVQAHINTWYAEQADLHGVERRAQGAAQNAADHHGNLERHYHNTREDLGMKARSGDKDAARELAKTEKALADASSKRKITAAEHEKALIALRAAQTVR